MTVEQLAQKFKIKIPIRDIVFWNGRPDFWSNLPKYGLSMSQRFGMGLMNYGQFGLAGHNGLDIQGQFGTPIVAPCKMWISYINPNTDGYGNSVWAETETLIENGDSLKLEFVFGHLSEIIAKPFKWYEAGELIGKMGSTGFSSGNHLHFGIRPWIGTDGTSMKHMFSNQYGDWVDCEPFMPHIVWDYNELYSMKTFDNKLIRNQDTGALAWFYAGYARPIDTKDDAVMTMVTYIFRNSGGEQLKASEWNKLEFKSIRDK
jgi:murein DD-endopeptidase MepM/ murein hydrolase activator NlpD